MMDEIFNKLFIEKGYQLIKKMKDIKFYGKNNSEYFMTIEYSIEELKNFFEIDKTEEVLQKFKEFQTIKRNSKKNTTLYIFVKTDEIKKFMKENKNIIFKIEEDQYYFRKHIIVYTERGISNIKNENVINETLHSILKEEDRINKFIETYNEDEEYFIAIQLMAKIPFLVINFEKKPYETLYEKIRKEDEILRVVELTNWLSKKYDDYFVELKEDFLSELNDSKGLQELFSKCEDIIK